jgi:LmbE family N-acetylglucosaminyl deacetylase
MVNNEWVQKISELLDDEEPDIVFAHWPIDSHKDHQVASPLSIQSGIRVKNKCVLYFFEVCTGEQTMVFPPRDYVDISETQDLKKKALYCHVSQDPPSIYQCGHTAMEEFRGRELGVEAAEGSIRMTGKKNGDLIFNGQKILLWLYK